MINNSYWALITGASSGIGKEFAHVLAQKGMNLILIARRDELLIKIKNELESKYQIKIEILKSDLALEIERKKVLSLFEKFKITYFINNAGIFSRESFDGANLDSAERLINLNVIALTHLSHGAIREMKKIKEKCYLLNIGSLNSFVAVGNSVVYAATKAYVKSFTIALSEELRSSNIHCACLCPGPTDTEILSSASVKMDKKGEKFLMPAYDVAKIGIDGALKGKIVIVPGLSNKLTVLMNKIFPETFMTMISTKVLGTMMGKN